MRAAVEVGQQSLGLTPLVNESFPISPTVRWFVEGDLPVRFSQSHSGENATSVAFATHVGLAF